MLLCMVCTGAWADTQGIFTEVTSGLTPGKMYVFKNKSNQRNAFLKEFADDQGKLRINGDPTSATSASAIDLQYVFTLESGNGGYKIKAQSGKYVPVIEYTQGTATDNTFSYTSETADIYTLEYSSSFWTIKSNTKNLCWYNFGPNYRNGMLLLTTNNNDSGAGSIGDGGQWAIYEFDYKTYVQKIAAERAVNTALFSDAAKTQFDNTLSEITFDSQNVERYYNALNQAISDFYASADGYYTFCNGATSRFLNANASGTMSTKATPADDTCIFEMQHVDGNAAYYKLRSFTKNQYVPVTSVQYTQLSVSETAGYYQLIFTSDANRIGLVNVNHGTGNNHGYALYDDSANSNRIVIWGNGDSNDKKDTWTVAKEEELTASIAVANEILTHIDANEVGYPTQDGNTASINTLRLPTSKSALSSAISTLYASANINLPEAGKAYTITSVTRSGTTRVISYSNTTQQLAIGSSDDNVFICRKLDNGKYVFTNNSGKYMRLLANSYKADGTKWKDTYDATWSSFSIAKMPTEGNHYASNTTADQVFGLLTIQGPVNGRGNGTIYLMAAASQFNSGNDNDLYFTDSGNSCGFRFEEVPNPNTIKLTNPNKSDDIAKKTLLDKRYVGTFSAPYAVQLSDEVEAYIASVSDNVVTFAKLGNDGHIVPKNTGVMLYAPEADNDITEVAVPAIATVDMNNLNNAFEGSNAGTVTMQEGFYILGKKNGVGFYPASVNSTLARNKAYLNLREHNVSAFQFEFEDEGLATDIHTIDEAGLANATVAYDLSGRRCNTLIKGISIVGGKKIIR